MPQDYTRSCLGILGKTLLSGPFSQDDCLQSGVYYDHVTCANRFGLVFGTYISVSFGEMPIQSALTLKGRPLSTMRYIKKWLL